MSYLLRLQALDGYLNKFQSVFVDNPRFTRVLAVHHTGKKKDNPHYHFVIDCDYKTQALRVMLKKEFTLAKGNRHLSLKQWDGDEKACSYLFHEGTEAIISKGYTWEEITKFKESDIAIRSEMTKASDIVVEVAEYFKRSSSKPSQRDVFYRLIDLFRNRGDWLPDRYRATRYVVKVFALLAEDDDDKWRAFKNNLFNEYFQGSFNLL